ncbi:hypothetical protein VPH35_034729 [Triticum aestivum]
MASADVPLTLSPSSSHRAAHHVRLPTTPPPPPSCAAAKEATTAAHLRSSTIADPSRPPPPTAGPPPPRVDQELRLGESYAILEPRLPGSRGSTKSLPSPPTRASPVFPDPFKRIRVPRQCSGPPLAAAGGPPLATFPLSIACYAAWASWSATRRRWTAGGRRHPSAAHALALARRRPCPILPSATTFPTPSSDLRSPLPSSSSSASTSSLLPPSSLNKPSSDTLSSATCFSNHRYATVVRSGRRLLQSWPWRRRSGGSIPAASGEHRASTTSKQSRPMMQQRRP